jgi:hypothetical protein
MAMLNAEAVEVKERARRYADKPVIIVLDAARRWIATACPKSVAENSTSRGRYL